MTQKMMNIRTNIRESAVKICQHVIMYLLTDRNEDDMWGGSHRASKLKAFLYFRSGRTCQAIQIAILVFGACCVTALFPT
jgi:hypothetical protein